MSHVTSDTPIRDVRLPRSDLAHVLVVVTALLLVTVLIRRERALVPPTLGIGAVLVGLMGLRTLH